MFCSHLLFLLLLLLQANTYKAIPKHILNIIILLLQNYETGWFDFNSVKPIRLLDISSKI